MQSSSMQASRSPWEWWGRETSAERRRLRMSLQAARALELQHAWGQQLQWARLRPDLALYTPAQLRQLIRLEGGMLDSGQLVIPTLPAWLRDRHDHDAAAAWAMAQIPVTYKIEKASTSSYRWWSGGACAGAAALLALLLLLLRDSCRSRLRTIRRRLSDEWPTPNVLATSNQPIDVSAGPSLTEDGVRLEAAGSSDLPPPYSECLPPRPPSTTPADACKPARYDEPPPPYSACYVAYYKHSMPSVHLQRQRTEESLMSEINGDHVRIEIPDADRLGVAENTSEHNDMHNVTEMPVEERLELNSERLQEVGVVQVNNTSGGIAV